jgi:hypothetical protein
MSIWITVGSILLWIVPFGYVVRVALPLPLIVSFTLFYSIDKDHILVTTIEDVSDVPDIDLNAGK